VEGVPDIKQEFMTNAIFEVSTELLLKIPAFWNVRLCSSAFILKKALRFV
jgi:hypothetical protein